MAAIKRLLPVTEVADLLGCGRTHVYELIATRKLATVDIGVGRAKTRIHEDELARYIAAHTTGRKRGVA